MGIALVAIKTIQMVGIAVFAAFQFNHAGGFVGNRIIALLPCTADDFIRDLFGNAVINHINDAADSAAAVQQGRGPAQYFNTLGQNGIYAIGMIRA